MEDPFETYFQTTGSWLELPFKCAIVADAANMIPEGSESPCTHRLRPTNMKLFCVLKLGVLRAYRTQQLATFGLLCVPWAPIFTFRKKLLIISKNTSKFSLVARASLATYGMGTICKFPEHIKH